MGRVWRGCDRVPCAALIAMQPAIKADSSLASQSGARWRSGGIKAGNSATARLPASNRAGACPARHAKKHYHRSAVLTTASLCRVTLNPSDL